MATLSNSPMWNEVQVLALQVVAYHWLTRGHPSLRPYLLTIGTGLYLALIGTVDYSVGLFTDFQHIPIMEPTTMVLRQVDTLCAYLLVNTIYNAYLLHPTPMDYSIWDDCVAPMTLFAFLSHLRENLLVNALRPLFVGIIPTLVVAAGGNQRRHFWNLILWFRVAAPLYAMRYLIMDHTIWLGYVTWVSYNVGRVLYVGIKNTNTL